MCLVAACWKVFWKKCLLMCCALGASLRRCSLDSLSDRSMMAADADWCLWLWHQLHEGFYWQWEQQQSLQHTSEAEWAEKVEGKLRSGIRWLNQICLVVRFKALGNFSVWKRQRITGRELRAMFWPTQKHSKSYTWQRVRPLFLDEFYSLINTSLL